MSFSLVLKHIRIKYELKFCYFQVVTLQILALLRQVYV